MNFFHKDFLLKTETAKKLYHNYAKDMPIFDFHCHLNPQEIFENNHFKDIAHAWLGGDHYKWRIMRSVGIEEKYITGDATGFEKFEAFAKALQYAIGSPVYHWAHMELRSFFDINEPLTPKNAKEIYDKVNAMLATDDFRVRNFIQKSNVTAIITTDDPIDNLEWHKKIKEDATFNVQVLPAFRPDKAINIDQDGFAAYIKTLGDVVGMSITSISELETALETRLQYFNDNGCIASDHGIAYVPFKIGTIDDVDLVLKEVIIGGTLTQDEINIYKTHIITFLADKYKELGWVMEIHYGVIRNLNTTMFKKLGPDTGFDAIGSQDSIGNMASLFGLLEEKDAMPKTMVFNINPVDNYAVGTVIGAFQEGGKMQFGTAWWFNDHINGMTAQINALADVGVLGKFTGMLTDSRSFLSYPRHDYFRRILCNIIGQWMEDGLYNPDIEAAGEMVKGISYTNAVEYIGLK